jgi:hypothetical protein
MVLKICALKIMVYLALLSVDGETDNKFIVYTSKVLHLSGMQ